MLTVFKRLTCKKVRIQEGVDSPIISYYNLNNLIVLLEISTLSYSFLIQIHSSGQQPRIKGVRFDENSTISFRSF